MSTNTIQHLPLEQIVTNENQPRKSFYQDTLEELAASIKERGVLEPITVRPIKHTDGTDKFQIVMGERRFRASRLAGQKTVPCIVKQMSDEDAQADALLENFQREDMNPIEKARAIQGLLDVHVLGEVRQDAGRVRDHPAPLLGTAGTARLRPAGTDPAPHAGPVSAVARATPAPWPPSRTTPARRSAWWRRSRPRS